MRIARCLLTVAFAAASFASAQTPLQVPTAPEPTGTVTGKIFCADTNEPARFAKVSLLAVPAASSAKPHDTGARPLPDTSGAGKVQTTLDGSFTLTHVKPGNYYVLVDKAGYLGPRDLFTSEELTDTSPEMLARRAATIPHVSVEANHTETAEIRLERGASVSGTVLYDDGSPASGLSITLLQKDSKGKWDEQDFNGSLNRYILTDDRGVFRASSLLPGEYIVQAQLTLSSSKTQNVKLSGGMNVQVDVQSFLYTLPFYGTGTAHLSEAKPFTLLAGQETPGQDMMIPIAKLHKLTGRVAAGRDAHFVNAATVKLVSRDDNKEIATANISREDGLFHFEFVPDGDYTLKITEARDVVWEPAAPTPDNPFNTQEKERVIATFGDTEEPIILRGDMLGTLATVSPDAVPNSSKPGAVNAQTGAPQPDGSTPPPPTPPQPQNGPHTAPASTPQAKSAVASTF
jgi:protocatechuate 3,4-dioxygenase beta subunit